jgi:hypothetical protein
LPSHDTARRLTNPTAALEGVDIGNVLRSSSRALVGDEVVETNHCGANVSERRVDTT